MPGSDYTIFLPFKMVTVSDEVIIESKILAVTRPRDMMSWSLTNQFHLAATSSSSSSLFRVAMFTVEAAHRLSSTMIH